MPLALLDFLNSREDAAVLWLTAALVFVVASSEEEILPMFGQVLRTLVPKLLLVFGGGALYAAGVVYLAARVGLWHRGALKETLYWFAASGLAMVAHAIERSPRGFGYVRDFLRRAVRLTIVAEFVVNLYVLPLFFELMLFPVFVTLTYGLVADDLKPAQRDAVRKTTTWLGVVLLSYVALRAVFDLGGLLSRETLEHFLVAPAMTVAFIPYLYVVGWVVRREQQSLRTRFAEQRERARRAREESEEAGPKRRLAESDRAA